ncbi:MAG: DUF1853 family protein [Saprospiraceae bacterium]
MKSSSRAASILNASSLSVDVTGVPSFLLADLEVDNNLDFLLPTNLRLGHLVERVVAELIKASSNFHVLHENIQISEGNDTIGELDFIIQNKITEEVIHLELAYKFYLFDPTLSSDAVNNWIGPNRNDSLKEKLNKLKSKQFPLLYHSLTRSLLSEIEIDKVSQALCLMTSLFVPYGYEADFPAEYRDAIKGYYLDLETLATLDSLSKSYYLPAKKEWGMEPCENESWTSFTEIEAQLSASLDEKRALLCWQKHGEVYSEFFVAWW